MSCARLILDEFKSNSTTIDELCNSVSETQLKDVPMTKRYISLPLMAREHLRENVGTVVKYADSRQKNVRNIKGSCMVVTTMAKLRAIPIMVAQARRVISAA